MFSAKEKVKVGEPKINLLVSVISIAGVNIFLSVNCKRL